MRPEGLRADARNGVLGRKNDGVLYVWDRQDVLKAYNFVNNRFVTTPSAVSKEKPGMTGGPTVSANGSDAGSGIVWAVTTQSTRSGGRAHIRPEPAAPHRHGLNQGNVAWRGPSRS